MAKPRSPAPSCVVALLAAVIGSPFTLAEEYDALLREGLAARDGGDMVMAEERLRDAYEVAADKREITHLLAMVIAYQERFEEADALLQEGADRYPDYPPLKIARARLRFYQQRTGEAAAILEGVLERDPGNSEARDLLGRLRAPHEGREMRPISPHQLVTGAGVSAISRAGFVNWYERFVEYRHFDDDGDQRFLRLQHDHRFGEHDSMLEGGWATGSRRRWPIEIAVAVADEADFLPEMRWRIGARRSLGTLLSGTAVLHLGYQQARYITGTTRYLTLQLEHYIGGTDAWITPGIGVLEDEGGGRSNTWQIGIHDQVTPRLRGGAEYIDAPETEDNVTTQSRTGHAYLAWQLTLHALIRLDVARNLREDSYARESVVASLQYRF